MRAPARFSPVLLLVFALGACDDGQPAGDECVLDRDCGSGMYCDNGYCRVDPELADQDRRRDVTSPDVEPDADAAGEDPDVSPSDGGGDLAPDDPSIDPAVDLCDGACGSDPVDDPLAALSTECAGFCDALCDFLFECGKEDPTCLVRCGQSARFQALSAAACTEGSHVIGLEECRLWLDCGGRACAIDEMCLEVVPTLLYECAPICDHTQAQPACPAGESCSTVTDAGGGIMSSLGMCFSFL